MLGEEKSDFSAEVIRAQLLIIRPPIAHCTSEPWTRPCGRHAPPMQSPKVCLNHSLVAQCVTSYHGRLMRNADRPCRRGDKAIMRQRYAGCCLRDMLTACRALERGGHMTQRVERTKTVNGAHARSLAWAGYAAAIWALLFAATSFYWALGGRIGVETVGEAITKPALAGDPAIVALVWMTGVLKVIAGGVALALVQPWGRRIPRWALQLAGWGTSVLLLVYGAANLAQDVLIVGGVIPTPVGLGAVAARWHLFLWDPWWLLGGLLFALATWRFSRETESTLHRNV